MLEGFAGAGAWTTRWASETAEQILRLYKNLKNSKHEGDFAKNYAMFCVYFVAHIKKENFHDGRGEGSEGEHEIQAILTIFAKISLSSLNFVHKCVGRPKTAS